MPAAAPQTVYVPQRPSRLIQVAAWVGIVAGAVFIVAVIFGTGFVLGKNVGDGQRYHHRGHEMMQRPGPGMFPPGGFERGPGFPGSFGPGGPGGFAGPGGPPTPAPQRP
ncbi:Conserved protein of uncharacterised function, proline rich protein [Mycolicibacterium aurum]|uniref:Conserved protein of uncharacterized function, proline rich protein n=1 Tax=Mycolicibacterium aurum TaxID=1791 RepID=A0A448J0D0_MYCAU|nr:Conserved protein of uncharacterised function, proline rich protein [Mycolicibacterium aurum]